MDERKWMWVWERMGVLMSAGERCKRESGRCVEGRMGVGVRGCGRGRESGRGRK